MLTVLLLRIKNMELKYYLIQLDVQITRLEKSNKLLVISARVYCIYLLYSQEAQM